MIKLERMIYLLSFRKSLLIHHSLLKRSIMMECYPYIGSLKLLISNLLNLENKEKNQHE